MKNEDKVLCAIKRRKDLDPVRISLRKLLASSGMEGYLSLCSDRLAENEKIDGEDTQINLQISLTFFLLLMAFSIAGTYWRTICRLTR